MDTVGNKVARKEIAEIKVAAPEMACQVIDWAIQAHGGGGVTEDFPLAYFYKIARTLRIVDGPDEVHRFQLGRHGAGEVQAGAGARRRGRRSSMSAAMPELVPVLDRHRFDEAALARHLRAASAGLRRRRSRSGSSRAASPTRPSTSRTAAGDYVLRKKPPGKLLPRAHAVEREYRIIRALEGSDVPVPRARAAGARTPSVIGTPFFVMDHVPGRIFFDRVPLAVPPADRAAIFEDMARVLAALHRVDWRAAGLEGFGRPEGYMRAPGRALDPAVGGARRSRRCRRWTGWPPGCRAHMPGRRGGDHRAWRLPPRQPDHPPDRAAHRRGARLGAGDDRASAGRSRLCLPDLPFRPGAGRRRPASWAWTSPAPASRTSGSSSPATAR